MALEKLKAAFKAATTGHEWWIDDDGFVASGTGDDYITVADTHCADPKELDTGKMDSFAKFITLAHNAMPELLAEIERLQWLEAELQRVRDRANGMESALSNAVGAMASMREQIEQMAGMFTDSDGAIQSACDDHDEAVREAQPYLDVDPEDSDSKADVAVDPSAPGKAWDIRDLKAAYEAAIPGVWVVDEDEHDTVENMADCLLRDKGTGREWTAVGLEDEKGYAESLAYCDTTQAVFIALAHNLMPLLLECYNLVLAAAYGNTEYEELERIANDLRAKLEGDAA